MGRFLPHPILSSWPCSWILRISMSEWNAAAMLGSRKEMKAQDFSGKILTLSCHRRFSTVQHICEQLETHDRTEANEVEQLVHRGSRREIADVDGATEVGDVANSEGASAVGTGVRAYKVGHWHRRAIDLLWRDGTVKRAASRQGRRLRVPSRG